MKNVRTILQGITVVLLLGLPSTALAASEPFIGEIMMFGGNFCPRGWENADGQLLPVSQNDALFSLLGTMYGGDGRTTFGLPDLRGRVPLHAGTGPELTEKRQGEKGGEENHVLSIAEFPNHQHILNGSSARGSQVASTGNLLAKQNKRKRIYAPTNAGPLTPMHSTAIGATGGDKGHNIMQPYLSLRFCIALQGVYPSRN